MARTLGVKILERLRNQYYGEGEPILVLDVSPERKRTEVERVIDEVVDEHLVHISVAEAAAYQRGVEDGAVKERGGCAKAVFSLGNKIEGLGRAAEVAGFLEESRMYFHYAEMVNKTIEAIRARKEGG